MIVATIDDQTISPAILQYLNRAMRQAREQDAECLVVVLDTPGGVLTSTRQIVKQNLNSPTPVVVYVSPPGSRAASAGVFITLSAHVAAMAPGTTIGAAHPVQVGTLPTEPRRRGDDDQEDGRSPLEEKIVNDTVSWARGLAEQRGRNADWAARTVTESISVSASEALEAGAIDLIADDLEQLLEELDGRTVQLPDGSVTLRTAGASAQHVPMWWGEQLLAILGQPNVAFLLMIFGFYGILFELYSPGWGVPGTLGLICLLLGFFGLAMLPVNYLGVALLLVAMGLFAAELFVTSYGALALAGTLCLLLGGIMLVDSPAGFSRVTWNVLLPVATATVVIVLVLVSGVVRTHRAAARTGTEGLIGQSGRADVGFSPRDNGFVGAIRVHGERWRAVSSQPIESGRVCRVKRREGLTLVVEPVDGETSVPPNTTGE